MHTYTVHGLGRTRRVTLCGTLLATVTDDEAAALFARELERRRLRHGVLRFAALQLLALPFLALAAALACAGDGDDNPGGAFSSGFHESFGFAPGARPAAAALLLAPALAAPAALLAASAAAALSRRLELAADAAAARLDHGRHARHLRAALLHIEDRNKGALNVDPLYAAACCARPPLAARLAALDALLRGRDKKGD